MRAGVALVLFCVLCAGTAIADDKPWAQGVPEAEQSQALDIYKQGNGEFEESRFAQALAKYREALKHWDHPAIRFNMAVCLVNLDQPREAWDHLEKALAYGEAPLGADLYAQGITYKKLLLGQLSHLKVTCSEPGAQVTLDGKPLIASCPGESTQLLIPGEHQVVATKNGFMTETSPLVLLPGKDTTHDVKLMPIKVTTKLVRRWKARTPWIFVGAGAGALLLGGALEYLAKQDYDTYDRQLTLQCPSGCSPEMPPGMQQIDSSTEAYRSRARIENITGASLLVAGGAVAVAGLVGVYLNIPKRVVEHGPAVTPMASPGTAGASLTWSW